MAEGLSRAKQELAWKFYPHTFAEKASAGQWIAHRWLEYLSKLITPQIVAGNARILLSAPPQHGKSEFLSNWLPTWFLHMYPERKIILGTYGQDYGNKWGSKVRENLVENPISRIPMRNDTLSKKKFMTAKGGQMMVAGVDGGGTGEGAHLFVVDDPYKNPQEANSKERREKVMDWFRAVANTRLQSGGSIVIMHTRWNDDDLIGELSKEAGYTYINLQAIYEEVMGADGQVIPDPLGRAPGEALCRERFTEKDLAQKRIDVTDLFWFPMYQGTAANLKGSIISQDDIQYYDELPKGIEEWGIFADLTYEKKEENDFAVFEAWCRKGADIYLVDQIREKMGINEQLTAFETMIKRYPDAFHKEIEKKANGAAVIDLCEDKIPGIVANNPMTSKGARLAAVSPLYKSHNVHFPRPNETDRKWVKNNVYEITRMTLAGTKAKHDDTVDTGTMAVAHFGRMSSVLARLEAMTRR
jgi:predicted phage terminase large subunit-like protein